ncbi:MAG TPA: protein kinase [Nocardioides sp.]|nr:protein kinase [Nocardioides sp.]
MAQLPRVGDHFGRYRIDDRIGQGGMGVVFGATDTSFDRRVALKVVSALLGDSPDFRRRFEREASLLARLSSPHVIDIYDYGVQDGCPYIATQFIGGGDLGHLLQSRGAMPPRLAAQVCAQVADALHDAHRAGVVHRDVKPSNVLLRDPDTLDLHAYLCDFGIARTEADGLTVPGSVTGTWSYLSPECGKGASGSPASDVYALGCLFWATLTGAPPFRGSDVEIAIAHQQAPVPQLAGADEFTRQVNLVLTRSLAKDPRHRYPDADRMRIDLLAAAGLRSSGVQPVFQPGATAVRPATPTPSGTPSPPPRSFGSSPPVSPPTALSGPRPGSGPRRRRTSLVVAGACAAMVLVGGGAFAITQLGSDKDDPGPAPEPTTAGPTPGEGLVANDLDGDGFGDLAVTLVQPTSGGPDDNGEPTYFTWHSDGETLDDLSSEPAVRVDKYVRRAAGDFDGDEQLDVLDVLDRNAVPGHEVTGELSGGDPVDVTLGRPKTQDYATLYPGDVDGDGDDDLVMGSVDDRDGFRFLVARSDGAGGFSTPEAVLEVRADTTYTSVEVGDYDGDDRADIALLETDPDVQDIYPESTLSLYLGNADGFTEDGTTQQFSTGYGPWMETGDFDGDGSDELLILPEDENNVLTMTVADYDGGVTQPMNWGLFNPEARDARYTGIGVTDLNGDGRDDVVNVDPARFNGKSIVMVALSTGEGFEQAAEWARWSGRSLPSRTPQLLGNTFP